MNDHSGYGALLFALGQCWVDVEQTCTVLAEVGPAPCDQRGGSGRVTLI